MKFLIFLIFSTALLLSSAGKDESERVLSRQKRLLFPEYTVLQISLCLVAQISSLPSHKVAINSGFQMNYNMPYQLSDFYNPMFWARTISNETNPIMSFMETLAKSESRSDDDDEDVESDEESGSGDDLEEITSTENEASQRSKRDLTAAQFYSGLTETLSYSGYHEECMLKSVCELAAHPLHYDEDNIVHDVLHFILTPSLHQSFDEESEASEKKSYEDAEEAGRSGADCELLYGSNCKKSFLANISQFIHANDV